MRVIGKPGRGCLVGAEFTTRSENLPAETGRMRAALAKSTEVKTRMMLEDCNATGTENNKEPESQYRKSGRRASFRTSTTRWKLFHGGVSLW